MDDKQEAKRQEILLAALRAFSSGGYDKTSMADIVEATGLSKGTLYWYFKNKQELYSALVTMVTEQLMQEIMQTIQLHEDKGAAEHIRSIFQRSGEILMQTDANSMALYTDFLLQAWHDETLRAKFTDYYQQYMDMLETIIQRGIDQGEFRAINARQAAHAVVGALDGISLQALVVDQLHMGETSPPDIRQVFSTMADMILLGLQK